MTRITACFCEGTYPRRHGENMQTPHRKALSPTPPRVWALMTRRRGHAPSAHSVPGGNRTQDLLAVRRQRYRLRHRAPLDVTIVYGHSEIQYSIFRIIVEYRWPFTQTDRVALYIWGQHGVMGSALYI